MNEKNQYKTRQREELLAFLRTTKDEHVTASDVCRHFERCGCHIGTATVYRQLERMVDEGLVNKYSIDAATPACFAYIGERHEEGTCFHCKCERCGKLIHMRCEELESIGAHVLEHHGFRIDPMRTVFYGLCGQCQEAEA